MNRIAGVGTVGAGVGLVGAICFRLVQAGDLSHVDGWCALLFAALALLGPFAGWSAMRLGIRSFEHQQF